MSGRDARALLAPVADGAGQTGRHEDRRQNAGRTDQSSPAPEPHIEDQQHGAHHDERHPRELETQRDVAEPDDGRLQQLMEQCSVPVDGARPSTMVVAASSTSAT